MEEGFLSSLNPQQKLAASQSEGAVMILAGAGSGKTKTLVARISYLLQVKKVPPARLLALTFSNKAAREMRERVSAEVKDFYLDARALQITTFHSFCARLLRQEYQYLGLGRNFSIYDASEAKAVVKGLITRQGLSTKELPPFEILYYIEELQNSGFYPGRVDASTDNTDPFYAYYLDYRRELHSANALDFGGLICGALELFETKINVLERYQNLYQYVLVDEYQDTNRAQFDLIAALSKKSKNICVVGDEDQSIYSWRGADIRNILDFEKTFPDATIFKLEQNYRSSKKIIEAASFVIEKNAQRKGKRLWTENQEGSPIEIIETTSEREEGKAVCRLILDKIENKASGLKALSEIAVFYRSNGQSRVIEDHLREAMIPYRIVGGVRFYERKEIKDLLAYLRLVVNPRDNLALSRVINLPARGIGATSLRKFESLALLKNVSLWEVLCEIVAFPHNFNDIRLSKKVRSALKNFVEIIERAQSYEAAGRSASYIYEDVLAESGYLEQLELSKDYESQARIENLQELGAAIFQYEKASKSERKIEAFLESITLDQGAHSEESFSGNVKIPGEVSLMTVHGAKGLEFPYVFILGAEENVFPSYQSVEGGGERIEEERRLFYVAMTRAMKELYILYAQGRVLFGQLRFNEPSRFLREIPKEYYIWVHENLKTSEGLSREDASSASSNSNSGSSKLLPFQSKTKFSPGSMILHAIYGPGEVLFSSGFGPEEKITVKFDDGEKKRFMVRYAPIERMQ